MLVPRAPGALPACCSQNSSTLPARLPVRTLAANQPSPPVALQRLSLHIRMLECLDSFRKFGTPFVHWRRRGEPPPLPPRHSPLVSASTPLCSASSTRCCSVRCHTRKRLDCESCGRITRPASFR